MIPCEWLVAISAPLIVVLTPAPRLPDGTSSLETLQQVHASGPSNGFALKTFSRGAQDADLSLRHVDGRFTGE